MPKTTRVGEAWCGRVRALWLVACIQAVACTHDPSSRTLTDSSSTTTSQDGSHSVTPPDGTDAALVDAPTSKTPSCGDGVLDQGEACEASLQTSAACRDLASGFSAGSASCLPDCRWDVSACTERASTCGDARLTLGEWCEPGLGSAPSCAEYSPAYASGEIRCRADCKFDFAECVRAPASCGNGKVEGDEQCDDGNAIEDDTCTQACRMPDEVAPLSEGPSRLGRDAYKAQLATDHDCWKPITRDRYQFYPAPLATLRYRIYVCRDGSGQQTFAQDNLQKVFEKVAELFETQVNVRLQRHSFLVFDHPDCGLTEGDDIIFKLAGETPAGVVPVIFASTLTTLDGSLAGGLGSLSSPVLLATDVVDTVVHELGHFFGLDHTHSCSNGFDDDGSQCTQKGDKLCDTPPDHIPMGKRELCDGAWRAGVCSAIGCGMNACADGSKPDRSNYMSYYACSNNTFSKEQIALMQCQLAEGALEHFDSAVYCTKSDEVCNNEDDDCDGVVDEGVVRSCGTDVGRCQYGVEACYGGLWTGVCSAATQPLAEICNNADDDCDGSIDEEPGVLEAAMPRCPTAGICAAGAARERCTGGAWLCEFPDGYISDECRVVNTQCGSGSLADPTCRDGIDNDCDGAIDENSLYASCRQLKDYALIQSGEVCYLGPHGRCRMTGGTYECVQLAEGCGVASACVGATAPQAEQCDGADWDCNGRPWDRGDLDNDGYGDCPGAFFDCRPNDMLINPGAVEICDPISATASVDDNCSQTFSEQFVCSRERPSQSCNVCGELGVQPCNNDSCDFQRVCKVGSSFPQLRGQWPGNHGDLRHNAGSACGQSHWCAASSSWTYHTYGPYVALGAASYHVIFEGTFSAGTFDFDVWDNELGVQLNGAREVPGTFSRSFKVQLDFNVVPGSACHPFEFRLRGDFPGVGGAELHSITLWRDGDYAL